MWRRHRDTFSPVRHVATPVLGSLTLIVPFVELRKPGPPAPYSQFPFIALAILAAAGVTAGFVVQPSPAHRSGRGSGVLGNLSS